MSPASKHQKVGHTTERGRGWGVLGRGVLSKKVANISGAKGLVHPTDLVKLSQAKVN